MLTISNSVQLPDAEVELTYVRAQGTGGQNVNKVSSAVHLRFDIPASSLPEFYKGRLLALRDSRITGDGVLIIKAQQYRTQEQNRADALTRLTELIVSAGKVEKKRRPTKPTLGSKTRRLEGKARRSGIKAGRGVNVENKADNEIFQELQMFSKNVAPSPENRNLSSGNENKIIIFPAMKRTGHPVGFCYGGMTLRLSSLHLLPWSNGYVHA